ncbi:hypothetical protein HanLR1_Chr14g0545051 [Helianthus annuus]|nr:hypothetical protein HanLR1_Chr14g0545051 [Helianthus annuus]
MGDSKLRVNIAKFAAENSSRSGLLFQEKGKGVTKDNSGAALQSFGRSQAFVNQGGGRLFSELFKKDSDRKVSSSGTKPIPGSSGVVQVDPVFNSKVLVVSDRTSTFKDFYGVSVVGRTVDLETLVDFDKLLRIAKVPYVRIQYLGGLSILISFVDEASANRFLESREV